MQANGASYSHVTSVARINELLSGQDVSYEEVDSIPSRDRLTFNNGFYVNCSALFVDLRDSSKMPDQYRRPTLAKIYRAYISETVALLNGAEKSVEVNIHGDAVWGVFDTTTKADINTVFETAAQVNSLIQILNCRLGSFGMAPIRAGIGVSYGRALMIKAGYKGSAINEVVWMGDVVNVASKLSNMGAKDGNKSILVEQVFYTNLKPEYQKHLTWNPGSSSYQSEGVNLQMEAWRKANC